MRTDLTERDKNEIVLWFIELLDKVKSNQILAVIDNKLRDLSQNQRHKNNIKIKG